MPENDDWATVISIASGIVAVALLLAWFIAHRFVDDILLLSLAIWIANLIEYATTIEDWGERELQACGFFLSFALLSVGAYVARRTAVTQDGR